MEEQATETKLMPCRKCKAMVELTTTKCPECGEANPAVTNGQAVLTFIILIAIIAAVLCLFKT